MTEQEERLSLYAQLRHELGKEAEAILALIQQAPEPIERLAYLQRLAYRDKMLPNDKLLDQYQVAKKDVAAAKSKEYALCLETFKSRFGDNPEEDKQFTIDIGGGWKLKGKQPLNRSVDKAALPAVLKALPEGIEESCIDYKPALKVGPYKKLSEKERLMLDEALNVKPGKPVMTLVPPKEAK